MGNGEAKIVEGIRIEAVLVHKLVHVRSQGGFHSIPRDAEVHTRKMK